jgi:two-component system CheB/CheR fusion protein
MVVFAQHNLIKDPPFTNIALISCRNLLIYLQPILQRKVLEFFNFSLNPGGILMLGTSETTGDMTDYFDAIDPKWKLYRSKGTP